MVRTLDSESGDSGSNPGRIEYFFSFIFESVFGTHKIVVCLVTYGDIQARNGWPFFSGA